MRALLDKFFRRLELMDRMMDAVGVTDKIRSLPGAAGVLRRASDRCLSCANPSGCRTLLDAHDTIDEVPAYCRNHDLFERLKHQIEAEQQAA